MTLHRFAGAVLAYFATAALPALGETETRTIPPIDSVVLAGAARLDVAVGPEPSLTLEGDPGLLAEMVTEVRGKTLYIGREAQSSKLLGQRDRNVAVRVTLPRLAALRLNGSSRTTITGFVGESGALALRGSGQIHAQGELRELVLQIFGSARADLSGLAVDHIDVSIRGSGRAALQPRQSLTATVYGSGKVTYRGEQVRVIADPGSKGKVEPAK